MRPKVYGTRNVQTKLTPDAMEWLERSAADRGITVSECLRSIVEAQRAAADAGNVWVSVPAADVQATRPTHPFTPQSGNALRCSVCGQRKAAHLIKSDPRIKGQAG